MVGAFPKKGLSPQFTYLEDGVDRQIAELSGREGHMRVLSFGGRRALVLAKHSNVR